MDGLLPAGSAFSLTLSFESGVTQTVGVAVVDPSVSATPEAPMPMDMPMPEMTEAAS